MQLAFLAEESWETLVGVDLRSFTAAIAQIRGCAGVIDRINASELIYRVLIEHRDPRFAWLRGSPTISERLREYANTLDFLRRVHGPKRKIRAHAWKAWIVAHVLEDTKRPHDLEVSSLIAAVLDDPKYSEKAHQAWRLKNTDILQMMVETLRERRYRRQNTLAPAPF